MKIISAIRMFFFLLLGGRLYKVVNGKPWVKEGFGDWEKLDTHLRDRHPEAYDDLIESKRKKD